VLLRAFRPLQRDFRSLYPALTAAGSGHHGASLGHDLADLFQAFDFTAQAVRSSRGYGGGHGYGGYNYSDGYRYRGRYYSTDPNAQSWYGPAPGNAPSYGGGYRRGW
jgi:hypothetical protein